MDTLAIKLESAWIVDVLIRTRRQALLTINSVIKNLKCLRQFFIAFHTVKEPFVAVFNCHDAMSVVYKRLIEFKTILQNFSCKCTIYIYGRSRFLDANIFVGQLDHIYVNSF